MDATGVAKSGELQQDRTEDSRNHVLRARCKAMPTSAAWLLDLAKSP